MSFGLYVYTIFSLRAFMSDYIKLDVNVRFGVKLFVQMFEVLNRDWSHLVCIANSIFTSCLYLLWICVQNVKYMLSIEPMLWACCYSVVAWETVNLIPLYRFFLWNFLFKDLNRILDFFCGVFFILFFSHIKVQWWICIWIAEQIQAS